MGGWFPFCQSLKSLRQVNKEVERNFSSSDEAAIIFTTGSTGPPKGVLYRHANFLNQAREIVEYFGIQPGGVDISAFPLFALFNIATGCTTVFPEMDFTRPADVDPQNLIDAANDWQANQSFGSPALWNTVGTYCAKHGVRIPTLKTVLSAGAPVPAHIIRKVKSLAADDAVMFTPYGATESLPVACADSQLLLSEEIQSAPSTSGICVGKKFPLIKWKVIEIVDGPIIDIADAREAEPGAIGELMVSGPVVTGTYVTRTDQNALHKVRDGDLMWHRMGDVGYLDEMDRFWFCGRKNHRVCTAGGVLYTVPCEAQFNQHPSVYRSALIGLGPAGKQVPHVVIEPVAGEFDFSEAAAELLERELRELAVQDSMTKSICNFHFEERLPTDIRHNSKIFREVLVKQYSKNVERI